MKNPVTISKDFSPKPFQLFPTLGFIRLSSLEGMGALLMYFPDYTQIVAATKQPFVKQPAHTKEHTSTEKHQTG
jgi:hypothetical protein